MPAHSSSTCKSHPEICDSSCKETLNPISNKTFDFLDGYIKDIASYFPDNILHLGGDELPKTCWEKSPEINDYLVANNMTVADAFSYFTTKLHAIARKYGKTPVGWNEVWNEVGTRLPKGTII